MTDPTKLRVVARGNHRTGYVGVIEIGFHAALIPFECGHRHPTTREARDCIRKRVCRLLDADEMAFATPSSAYEWETPEDEHESIHGPSSAPDAEQVEIDKAVTDARTLGTGILLNVSGVGLVAHDPTTLLISDRSSSPDVEGLDVERLARAMKAFYMQPWESVTIDPDYDAPYIAREYAALRAVLATPSSAPDVEGLRHEIGSQPETCDWCSKYAALRDSRS
jgi:hypothetical protein